MYAGGSEILNRFLGPLRSFLNPCGEFWGLKWAPSWSSWFCLWKNGELLKKMSLGRLSRFLGLNHQYCCHYNLWFSILQRFSPLQNHIWMSHFKSQTHLPLTCISTYPSRCLLSLQYAAATTTTIKFKWKKKCLTWPGNWKYDTHLVVSCFIEELFSTAKQHQCNSLIRN